MIRLDGLTVARPGLPRPLLDGITLTVPEGCLYGLVGPGAAGKSVLLRALVGLMPAARGRVYLGDDEVTGKPDARLGEVRARVGMLFQNNALFDHMTVLDNVAFPLRRLARVPDEEARARAEERLARVALPGFGPRMPSGLSGGQKKRVGVARATITRAPYLLYDEPAAGLDPVTSQKIFRLLQEEQRATGATVIMVSSDLDRLLSVTDRVGMLHRGRLVFDGSTAEAQAADEPLVRQFIRGEAEGPLA